MGLRPASETDTEDTTSDDISSSSASEISDSSLDEVVDAKTGVKQFVPRQLDEDGMSRRVAALSNQYFQRHLILIFTSIPHTEQKCLCASFRVLWLSCALIKCNQTSSVTRCEPDGICCAKFAAKRWRALLCARNCARQRWMPSRIPKCNRYREPIDVFYIVCVTGMCFDCICSVEALRTCRCLLFGLMP